MHFENCLTNAIDLVIGQPIQSHILTLIGSLLMLDTSSNKVNLMYFFVIDKS